MPICHKCRHNAEIERLRRICAACGGPCEDSHRGRSFVSLDAAADPDRVVAGRTAPEWKRGGRSEGTKSRVAERIPDEAERRRFLDLLAPFWQMNFEEWAAAGGKMRGMSDKEIAATLNWSIQRVWATWERVKEKWPNFAAFASGLEGLRSGGRRPAEKTETQTEMEF